MASTWNIRFEGSATVVPVPSAQAVLDGLHAGEWDGTDEVRGPDDADWTIIENHPQFADALSAMAPPRIEPPDESRLDMNPLIDVSLVLLIFFILTASYASLRRSIDVPTAPDDKKGAEKKILKPKDVEDRTFRVMAWMEGETVRVKVQDKIVELAVVEAAIKEIVASTTRREMILEIDGKKVPWGIEAAIRDAARGAQVNQIYLMKWKGTE